MNTATGGPAFPIVVADLDSVHEYGMTLRDYFAAKAIQGMCASESFSYNHMEYEVANAYQIADLMLKERLK